MRIKETAWEFSASQALKEAKKIVECYGLQGGQISLTHRPGIKSEHDKLFDATGSIYNYKTGKFRAVEEDFSVFNEKFRGTFLYEIYCTIGQIGRMRIMSMNGPTAYTVHRDQRKRYHLALQTNPSCFFVFPDDDEIIHVPADNKVYEIDTMYNHTFVNGSKEERIHLVMDNLNRDA